MPDQPTLRTAVFVDFDNTYIGLRNLDSAATAHRFASRPTQWLSWIEQGMQMDDEGDERQATPRRVIVRRCYLNPRTFAHYRNYFTRAGFNVIDCPPLTQQGKTSTDIHMVMDILDALNHSTRYDEFMILSADSDFTPVLMRLRAHDRGTAIVSIGAAAEAYKAAADIVIDGGDFLEYALDLPATAHPVPAVSEAPMSRRPPAPLPPAPAAPPSDVRLKERLTQRTIEIVRQSASPVALASLAQVIRKEFPEVSVETQWAGFGTFGGLIKSLHLEQRGLAYTLTGPGYLYDPSIHSAPSTAAPAGPTHEDIPPIGMKVNANTGVPSLSAEKYKTMFQVMEAYLRENEFNFNQMTKVVRDECAKIMPGISRASINFVMQGCAFAGHKFAQGDQATAMAQVFRRNVANLCRDSQLELTPDDERNLDEWIGASLTEPAPPAAEAAQDLPGEEEGPPTFGTLVL